MTTGTTASLRVVSLLGGATETVFRLGCEEILVGRSHECDWPPQVLTLPQVSYARIDPSEPSVKIDAAVRRLATDGLPVFAVDDEALSALQPNLIIVQDHCRICAVTPEDLQRALLLPGSPDDKQETRNTGTSCARFKTLVLKPSTLDDVLQDVVTVGEALGVREKGLALRGLLADRLIEVTAQSKAALGGRPSPKVAVLEWCAPLMGCGYWIPELVEVAGGSPILAAPPGGKTPTLANVKELLAEGPEVVIFALCGFDLQRAFVELAACGFVESAESAGGASPWSQLRAAGCRVYVCDGNSLVNRSGPRVAESAQVFAEAIHGEALRGHWGHYGTSALLSLDALHAMSRPGAAVEAQLCALARGGAAGVAAAFALNSPANRERLRSAERFGEILRGHGGFSALLGPGAARAELAGAPRCFERPAPLPQGGSQRAAAQAVLVHSKDDGGKGQTLLLEWTLVMEDGEIRSGEAAQPSEIWLTDGVGFPTCPAPGNPAGAACAESRAAPASAAASAAKAPDVAAVDGAVDRAGEVGAGSEAGARGATGDAQGLDPDVAGVCSFVPAGTEMMLHMGLGARLLGCTDECPGAAGGRGAAAVVVRSHLDYGSMSSAEVEARLREMHDAGTPLFTIDVKWLRTVRPRVVLTQESCDRCAPADVADRRLGATDADESQGGGAVSRALREAGLLDWEDAVEGRRAAGPTRIARISPTTVEEMLQRMLFLGDILNECQVAERHVDMLRRRLGRVAAALSQVEHRPRVLSLEGLDPLAVGGGWLPDVKLRAGAADALGDLPGAAARRPKWAEVVAAAPEVILLTPCGSGVERTIAEVPDLAARPGWSSLPAVKCGHVYILDHGCFSRGGPSLVDAVEALAGLLHPTLVPWGVANTEVGRALRIVGSPSMHMASHHMADGQVGSMPHGKGGPEEAPATSQDVTQPYSTATAMSPPAPLAFLPVGPRIVSFSTTATTVLAELSCLHLVVGVDRFGAVPGLDFRDDAVLSLSAWSPDIDLVKGLKPDMIIVSYDNTRAALLEPTANSADGRKGAAAAVEGGVGAEDGRSTQLGHAVRHMPCPEGNESDVWKLAIEQVMYLAACAGVLPHAGKLVEALSERRRGLALRAAEALGGPERRRKRYFVECDHALYTAAACTPIACCLAPLGLVNVMGDMVDIDNASAYPMVSAEQLKQAAPDVVFVVHSDAVKCGAAPVVPDALVVYLDSNLANGWDPFALMKVAESAFLALLGEI
eukprot:gene4958-6043_t